MGRYAGKINAGLKPNQWCLGILLVWSWVGSLASFYYPLLPPVVYVPHGPVFHCLTVFGLSLL